MGQNQAAASMVKKQMGHCTRKSAPWRIRVTPKMRWK